MGEDENDKTLWKMKMLMPPLRCWIKIPDINQTLSLEAN